MQNLSQDIINFGDTRLPERFWLKCLPEPNSGCWLWVAARSHRKYYGAIRPEAGLSGFAHKYAYQLCIGDVPAELELDHICNVSLCVNPNHLRAITHLENLAKKQYKLVSHCKRGHVRSPSTTENYGNGAACTECRRERVRNYMRNKRLKNA